MSSPITSRQEQELREAFDVFDKDHSGKISARELKEVFKALEINATDDEIKAIMSQMDTDDDGEVSYDEFLKVMTVRFTRQYTYEEMKQAFDFFDKDSSGYISSYELKCVLNRFGYDYSDAEIMRMINSLDTDGNGKITFDEFKQLLKP